MYFDVELTEFSVDWIQHMKGGKKKETGIIPRFGV